VTSAVVRLAPALGSAALRSVIDRIPRPVLQGLLAFVSYQVAFIIVAGMPLVRHLTVPNLRQYWTDEQFYAWSLGWWPYAVSHGINPLFSSQIGAPHGYDLAWASTAPSVDLAMWPVTAAFGVVVSYNIVTLLIPPVSAWAAFVLARRLTGRFWASLLAGAIYGFCPYELLHTWQGQPNLTVIGLFPLLAYLMVRWWDGSLTRTWFVIWMTLALAVQFYTFNENFAELTAVLAGGLVIGFAVAGREARRKVLRLARLTAVAYAAAIILASPYLVYSLKHYQGNLQRETPDYSIPLIRLIVPSSSKMFGLTPLIRYSNNLRPTGIENYVGIPLIVILLVLAVFTWRSRMTRLLVIGFVFVLALGVGPHVVVTNVRHTFTLPWAGLWKLPFARSSEPTRFIAFGVLVLAIALALWLAAPATGRLRLAARWGIGLLAAAVIISDSYTSYIDVQPVPPGYVTESGMHPVNQLPAFITDGMYRRYLRPGEIVVILTGRGNAGMLFQAASGFYFRIAGGYINASLTPTDAFPPQVVLLARETKTAVGEFDEYARSQGIGALIVEHTWARPWMRKLPRLAMHGTSVGGVTIYPMAPWLASQARLAGLAHRAHVAHLVHQAPRPRLAGVPGEGPSPDLEGAVVERGGVVDDPGVAVVEEHRQRRPCGQAVRERLGEPGLDPGRFVRPLGSGEAGLLDRGVQ
jgi:hypothetical protein